MTKKELLKKGEELMNLAMPYFRKFIGDDLVISSVAAKKRNNFWIEEVSLSDRKHLCSLRIARHYYAKQDNSLSIEIKWFDWNEVLMYTSFLPKMDNDSVLRKVRVFLAAADRSAFYDNGGNIVKTVVGDVSDLVGERRVANMHDDAMDVDADKILADSGKRSADGSSDN